MPPRDHVLLAQYNFICDLFNLADLLASERFLFGRHSNILEFKFIHTWPTQSTKCVSCPFVPSVWGRFESDNYVIYSALFFISFTNAFMFFSENYKTVADLGPSLPIFDLVGSEGESSGTLHPGLQFESGDESNEQVAVIFTEIDKVVDRANIIVPQSDDEEPMVSLESRNSSMHNRIGINTFSFPFVQSYTKKNYNFCPFDPLTTDKKGPLRNKSSRRQTKSRKIKGRIFPTHLFYTLSISHRYRFIELSERKKKEKERET